MTAADELTRTHPVHRFAGRLDTRLDEVVDEPRWSMSTAERVETIALLHRAESRLAGLRLALVADAEAAAADDATTLGATSTPGLLRDHTISSFTEARCAVRTARDLAHHPGAQDAVLAGRASVAQARVILAAVKAVPKEHRGDAEVHLLDLATRHDTSELRALGRHVLGVVAPDVADDLLDQQLPAEERKADRDCYLDLLDHGDGTCIGRFALPSRHGVMLQAFTDALINPARTNPPEPLSTAPTRAEKRGHALCELLERYPTDRLPATGGGAATIVVTMTLPTLLGGLQSAGILETDLRVSAAEARRLACAHGVIPMVLGGASQVLDSGRRRRLHTPIQRLALAVQQDGRCAVDRCDRPASWCDADHVTPYAEGGPTSVANGLLLCPRHHTHRHSPQLRLEKQPDGRYRFHRRQ